MNNELTILFSGVPPGVKVGVFEPHGESEGSKNEILLETTTRHDYVLEKQIPQSLIGKKVRVVIRSAGFKPYSFDTEIERYGLYHAAYLIVDNVYSGSQSEVPPKWDTLKEHRKAEILIINKIIALNSNLE